jgi:hypothetical protein
MVRGVVSATGVYHSSTTDHGNRMFFSHSLPYLPSKLGSRATASAPLTSSYHLSWAVSAVLWKQNRLRLHTVSIHRPAATTNTTRHLVCKHRRDDVQHPEPSERDVRRGHHNERQPSVARIFCSGIHRPRDIAIRGTGCACCLRHCESHVIIDISNESSH